MANPNDNLRRLYQNGLKHFSLPDFDTFQQDMRDEEKRKRFYNNMQGAYSLPDFDTFSQDIGAVTPPPAQPQAQAQPQQTTSTVKPVTDNTAQQASVQPTVQTSSQPAQPEGWKPTPMQQRAFQMQMDEANARLKKQGEEFKQRMEGIEKGNRPGAFMGEREFNPQTGKMETHYYTTQGERVGTRMEQSHANTEYHNWWENNTEAGKRSKEQRLQREFDEKLSYLWQRHNPAEGESAAEQAWSAAESAYNAKTERNREAANFNVQNFAMNSTDAVAFKQMETVDNFTDRLTTHDMDVLMDNAWNNLGEEGQKSLIDDCYQMLRRRNPGVDDLVLYGKAKEFARQQSDLRMYHLAVEKNLPKSNLEYFMRKVGDMNLVTNIGKGIAVNRVKKTGDMAAYEAANEQYRQDGHKILDVAGTVTGFALDPTTWMSAGVGGMATRGAMWAGGRVLAGRGATAAVTNAATRQFATSMTGRVIGGIAGGAANFGTFEGIKEMETQFAHGGHIVGQDDTGRYLNEGYSASAVAGQAAHGFLMGGAIGWLTPVSGNVADKLVRSTSSTGLKVMERAGVYSGATMLEGTIFSVPEWIEGNRDAMDVWTDNMAMMVGFKAKHMIKSAGNVLGDLKASFDSPTNGRKNRLDFESRLRQRMDAPSDGGLSLTRDEAAELSKHGYGDLRELVESAERTGDATKGELITANAPEIVSRLTDMVTDPRISEAARAKMYYYATGRKLPESTVMKGELIEDGEGGFIVESQGANGVITSRSFKSRKAADLELERIKRQTELNHIEIGERYQQTADFENRLQEACRTVAAENGWDMVEVYRTCEEARRNNLRGGDKQFDEAQQNILRKVTEAMGEFEETSVTDNMRGRINDKYGVDIDNAIRKEANRRTIAEQTAIDEYLDELIPKNAKERNTVEDAEAEDITNQKLLTDEPEATTPTNDAPIDPRFDNPTTPEYDPHQPGGEQKPVGRAVMKYQDRPVEVLSGRVVMMEDGTMIDNERSDASIVVRDLETGKVEMVSPDAILSYEGYPAEVEVPQDNVAPEAETPAEPQPKYTTGQIKIRNSDGTETRGVLTGFVDENGNHEYYVEGDLQQLHYASEHELDNILSEYTPDEPQEVKQPQPAEPQPVDPNRPTQEGVANVEDYDNGYSFGIDETQGISDSELTAKISELRTDAERLTDFGRGMLEAYEYEQQRRAMEQQLVPVDAETVPKTEETTLNPMETGVNITETVPKTEIPIENVQQSVDDGNVVVPAPATNEAPQVDNVSQPDLTAQAEPTPLQRIPRNEKNEPIFEQAESPEVGWDALVEFSEGDAATAKEIADTMVEEKRKAFEKAQKLKPKGKTPTEILASKKANTAELTKAQAEYEQWQRMAGVENARQSAIRSQQEVEARRLAAERAEAEKAEREAREEAARLEREALEGIPEWHMDTPENARKRGVRRFSGQMFTRQEPVQGVVGNEVEVKFSQKDLPKGRVAVIEASQLQPSHVQGQRNPMFFIEEAQPKNRTEAVSMFAAKEMAEGIRPKEITGSVTAYTGAPTVNTRGEVIQGNNRSDALRYLWQSNLPQQQQTYKQYLIDNAEQFGIDPEAVNAMQNPVLVNMLDVDDAEAIRLGQMTAQDTESGGIERIKPKNVAQTLGDNMRTFANMLLSSGEEDVSFGQLVDRNGTEVMKWMNQVGAISNTQFQSAFDSKSNLTAEAKNDLQKVLYQAVFKGASQQLEEMFDKLPAKAQRAILATAFRDMDSPFAGKMLPEIQASIIVYNQLMSYPTFANAKKMEEVLKAVEAFKQTIALDDRFEHYMPADNFSNFALHLAAMYKATDMSQATIASYFNQMYDLAQGKKAATLFDEADTTEYPLAEVINQVLNFEYQPAKNGNNDVANGGADVALRNQVSQGGELRGNEPPASGEQTPTGTEPSDSGAGASDDSSTAGVEAVEGETPQSTDAAPATVQAAVEAASAEVNTEPTPAQAEAGNYKKGHITIGEFDITIENPAGSVRKGIDADGKEWSTTMANTYGYIKGTEGVDGDHIDVFLHENMDMWNGRKVYVVDQTNTDGSFDEHKVMLGFNNKDEAMSAYLANYDATWGQTHPGLRISETNIEDFNKWVQSSHRKTKPFADYSTVSKITDEAPVEQPTQPAAAITGEGYKVEPKPYTNKQGKTLDTYLVTFDRDFSKEELSTLRAKAKALKGWYDRETRGWMLRSADDAKAFAKDIVGKSEDEVADEAPLSLADMEKPASDKPKKAPVNRVNVEGVMADLSTKGETKLSDHAEPVEPTQTKPKKRRWISDEDADEFNNLRDNLRNHFGKGDDIVQESAEGYGKPQPKQMDAEVLRMGTRMTYLMMKGGLRSFADYCEAMIDELPDIFDDMRPHLKSLYAAAQLMENSMENRALEEDQDLFGDITAQLSGSEYAMLKNQIEKEVRKLTAQRKSWEADQTYIHNRKRQIAGQNKEAEKRIAENKSYLEKVEAATVGDITVDKLSYPSVEAMEDFFTEQNKRKAELQEQVRKSGYSSRPATSDITISVGGFNFHVHTEINRETKQGQQGDLFYSAPAKMTYSCPELGIEAMPVKGNVIKNAVTEILNDVVSGEDFRGRIEAAERSIERNNAELQSISARDGVPFKFTEELAKAEEKLSEYEDLMKAEMEAKEAKYAELDKEVEAASNIELTEEDSEDAASEPIASYSEENANFASRYETQDGKTINYTSENAEGYGGLFDFDFSGENAGGNEVGMRSGANDLQRQGDTGLNRHNSRLDKEAGEFSLIERVFRESGSFNFTSGEKIESADDVAFIFSALEDAAKEHSFVVLVKDGKPTVVELGMGTFTATMVDIPTASLAYNRIQPDQVYFVHNHPSGNLMCSPQDVQMLRKIADISKVPVHGVIINLKTGKYGTFDTDNTSGVGQKRVPENESPLAVHTLDKQIFAPNYDPMEQPLVRGSEDVAKFLNSQRMGDRAKMSFIILSRAGRIVGNIHTPFTKLPTKSDEIARYISERVIQFGGESAILYGDFTHEGSKMVAYRNLKDNLNKVGGTTLLDVVNVEGNNTRSANDDGLLYELGSEYGASTEAKSSHAERMSKKFNTPIRIVTDTKELTNDNSERQARMRRSKGFYDPATGEVVIVLPNNANVEDVAETVFHEVVAHKGLREMIGEENYDAFCDEIYNHLKDDLKQQVEEDATRRFVNEPGKEYEHHRRVAVDEMFGRMSEKGFEDFTKAERGIWVKLKAKVLEAINKFLGSLKLPKWVKLGDNELRYMLWRSHEKLRTKGDYVDMARDAAKRDELGLSSDARFRDGETSDIWKDQSIGLEERITNAAIRLSNNQSADLTLRNDAMRAVTNTLQSLLHSMRNRRGTAQSFVGADRKVEAGVVDAMNAQAMFDRSTVKRVSDLARILMQNGYLSGMTSGEMQRLLSAVKNATAMHDIADSVQKIMDIMVDNQLRNGEASLRQLLAIRGSKVDARGVEVQGALDVEGQRTMEVVKKAISLTEDDITDRIAEALNRMSDPDQTIADQAAIEYAGLNMALDYVQNIANSKAEEKALRDSLKTAKEDRDVGRMTDDAYKQFIETTEDAIRKNKIERTEAYFNLVGRLSDTLRGSIENAKAFREAEKVRVNKIHHYANSDMEGRPSNEHHKDDWKDKFMNNGFVQFLFAPLGTFDQILRVMGNKSASGEGYLWSHFMRGWVDCRNKELQGVRAKFSQLDEKAAELFGKGKTWGDLIRMEGKLPKASVRFWDGGEMRGHELTQGNLLYIYMTDKMTDGRMKLRRMGITEDDITNIEQILDPRFKALGDWLQEEFLVGTRNEYNETHKRMFGASMAAIENYFPLKILANARIDKEEDVNQQNRPDGITTKTGSIIKRRVNNLALDITGADALSVILDHITQMEHWSAYAEWNRDLNTLRTYKRFRNQVINMTTVYGGGRRLWENVNNLFLMAAGEYRPPVSRLNKNAVNLAKGVTAAKVSFRLFTALKQFLSAPAYAPEVNLKSIAKSIANPYGDFKWCLENLPIFRERWHSRISGDPRLLKSDMDWKMWRSRVMEISSRIGMTPNAFVDAVTVSIGARAMYETRLNQYLKEGYPADAAEKRAMQDATILFNQTQQSSESPFLSTMQVDKDWLSTLFTVFRNSSMSYTRQTYDGARNLKRNLTSAQRAKSVAFMTKQILRDWEIDPESATDDEYSRANDAARKRFRRQIKKDVIRLATFGYVLEWLWNLGPYLPYIIFGYYISEKDKMWDDVITHSYFGSIEGLTGGDVMSSFGNMWASGEWSRNQLSKDMPLASDINTIANKFIGGKNAEAVNDILNLLVQSGIGMNPQSLTDAAIAITDACGDDPALSHEAAIFVMRVLQVPQSQLDKLYFDEIGLNGEEASKLTPQQLAARYAEYKVKRGTPLAPWSWGDEERLGKYEELAKDRMTERLESRGDAAVKEAYADFEARYKAVNEKAEKARAMIKTDYAAAAQAHAALQQDPDFTLYQRFGSLDKQLGRISKMWLTSKTPEEAALIASTIPAYRAGMVKVLQAETVENQQSAMSELTTLMNEFYSKYQAMQPQSQQLNR